MKTRLKATAYGSFPSSFLDGVSAVFKKEDFSFLNSSQYSVFGILGFFVFITY